MTAPKPIEIPSGDIRLEMIPLWDTADRRHRDIDVSTLAGATRWKELQDREREERLYILTKRAVFRGVVAAYFALLFIGLFLWGVSILIRNGMR